VHIYIFLSPNGAGYNSPVQRAGEMDFDVCREALKGRNSAAFYFALSGLGFSLFSFSQGAALGYEIFPFQGNGHFEMNYQRT